MNARRFPQTYCSQCGGEFGPGDSGFSHCSDHAAHKEVLQCKACYGKGWNDEVHAVDGHYSGSETLRMACQACDGAGEVKA